MIDWKSKRVFVNHGLEFSSDLSLVKRSEYADVLSQIQKTLDAFWIRLSNTPDRVVRGLFFVLAFALTLFFLWNSHQISLWGDEIISVEFARLSPHIIWNFRTADYNPPLFDFILHAISRVSELDETTARLPSVLAFFVLILAVGFYKSGKTKSSIPAALLFAMSFPIWVYAREARPYLLVVLTVTLVILKLLRKIQEPKPWTFSEVLQLVGLFSIMNYSHYCGVIFSASAFCSMLIWRKRLQLAWKVLAGGAALSILIYLPWMKAFLQHAESKPDWLTNQTHGLAYDFYTLFSFLMVSPFLVAGMVLAMLMILWSMWKKDRTQFHVLGLLHSFWVFPIALTFFILYVVSPGHLVVRHLIEAVPGLILAFVASLAVIWKDKKNLAAGMFLVVFGAQLFALGWTKPWLHNSLKMDDRAVMQSIRDVPVPCKDILIFKWFRPARFYLQKDESKTRLYNMTSDDFDAFQNSTCDFAFAIELGTDRDQPIHAQFRNFLEQKYDLTSERHFAGQILRQWKRRDH